MVSAKYLMKKSFAVGSNTLHCGIGFDRIQDRSPEPLFEVPFQPFFLFRREGIHNRDWKLNGVVKRDGGGEAVRRFLLLANGDRRHNRSS